MRTLLSIAVVLLLLATFCASARAENVPDPRLDVAASEIAGHPTTVHCEASADDWAVLVRDLAHINAEPEDVRGFTFPRLALIYLSPAACLSLRFYMRDPAPAEPRLDAGTALLTLLHESKHQAGSVDEGETDCQAVALVRQYAISLLGIPEQVWRTKTVLRWRWKYVWKRVRVDGRWIRKRVRVRVRVPVSVRTLVANPRLALVVDQAESARRVSPYFIDCTGVTP